MITYSKINKKIKMEPDEWKKYKNKTLIATIKSGQKKSPDQITYETLDAFVTPLINDFEYKTRVEKNDCFFFSEPIIKVNNINDALDIDVDICFFEPQELQKINWKNAKIDFKPHIFNQKDLDETFASFASNYPVIVDVKDREMIQQGDIVQLDFTITHQKQVIKEEKNLSLKAQKSDNFSINNEIIGKKIGESFGVNDPENRYWNITIHSAKEQKNIELNDESFKELDVKSVDSVAKMREEFEKLMLKDITGNVLYDFLLHLSSKIIQDTEINLGEEFTNNFFAAEFKQNIQEGGLLQDITKPEQLNMENKLHKRFIEETNYKMKFDMLLKIIPFAIKLEYNPHISQQDIDREWEFNNHELNRDKSPFKQRDDKQLSLLIEYQKCLLIIFEHYFPEEAKILKKRLWFTE